jgi:hypothetical protein
MTTGPDLDDLRGTLRWHTSAPPDITAGQKVTLRFEADRFPPDSYWYRVYDYATPTH